MLYVAFWFQLTFSMTSPRSILIVCCDILRLVKKYIYFDTILLMYQRFFEHLLKATDCPKRYGQVY